MRIRSLEPGKKADLIVLDLDKPHLQPFYGAYAALAWYAKSSDVATSIVDGRIVMEERRLTGLDEAAVLGAIQAHIPRWSASLKRLGSSGDRPCG